VAYILNFLIGCEGKLGIIGSMSNVKVFSDGEWWRLIFHMYLHAVVNAIIMSLIFPNSTSVGASAGIFGIIGSVCVMKWKKDDICNVNLKKGEIIYIIVFSILSFLLGLESFVTHFVAFVLGIIVGLLIQKTKCE